MKVVYIAHPINGNVHFNLESIKKIGRIINLQEPNVIPIAPYFFSCYALDDSVPAERKRGIKNNIGLLKKGFVDEIRLYGNNISSGMMQEIQLGIDLGISIKPMTKETQIQFNNINYKL